MKKNLPAFPCTDTNNQGMDLRDYFAAHALSVFLSQGRFVKPDEDGKLCLAMDCYEMADAMLKVRGAKEQSDFVESTMPNQLDEKIEWLKEIICQKIKAEAEYCYKNDGYMLDYSDFWSIIKGTWKRPDYNFGEKK